MGEQYLGNMQFTERVKEEANIVELIGQYVKLKKSGKSYVGLCPFHDEKTPSFHVTENPKLYYCFGCGEGGDVIGFFMKKEGMIFPEARDYVARESGIPVPVFKRQYKGTVLNTRDALGIAQEFFSRNINNHEAAAYCMERELDEATIKQRGIGYALNNWHALKNNLLGIGFKLEDLVSAGLVGQKRDSPAESRNPDDYYDFFRNRLMFPLRDRFGLLVGFAGRAISSEDEIKYLNTVSQTRFGKTFYNKSEILFGLSEARNAIRETKKVLYTEGYIDEVSARKIGMENVVASGGVAFTQKQAKILRDVGAEEIIFIMDMDEAGIRAAKKAVQVAYAVGLTPLLASISNKDIQSNEELRGYGKIDLDVLARHYRDPDMVMASLTIGDVIEFVLKTSEKPKEPEAQNKLLEEIVSYFYLLPAGRKMLWINKAAKELGIPEDIVQVKYFERLKQSVVPEREDVARRAELKILAENYIIGLLTHPVEYIKPFFRIIPPESSFFSPELREVYKIIIEETPQELPLKSPSNHQTDFVEDDKIEKAFNHLRMRYKEKKLKAFPANLIRRLMNGAPNDFEKTATTLFHIAKEDRRARKLEELIRASRESDTETAEKISTELLEM